MNNNVIDNLDFQQEKREEQRKEIEIINALECCPICGEPLVSSQYVYRLPDEQLAHTRCVLDYVDNESITYGDILNERRDSRSTESIF